MKSKIISLFLLTAILSLALVSAANFTITTSTPIDLTKKNNQTSFLITPTSPQTQTTNIMVTIPSKITDGNGNEIIINPPYVVNFNNVLNGETKTIELSYTGTVPNSFIIGKFTVNVEINASDSADPSNKLVKIVPINFINDFCDFGENGTDLSISRIDISNSDGDDDEWSPLDEITLKIEVSNDGNERVRDVLAEIGLINQDGKDVAKDLEGLSSRKIDFGNINDGDDKTKEIKFKVPTDFSEEDYNLIIKAYGDDLGEEKLCIAHSSDLNNDYFHVIKGQRETDEENHIIVDNIVISPETAGCGDTVQLSGEIVNIGDEDYQDQVKITLYNKELGINDEQILREDFDQGDSSSFTFDFEIPVDASEKTHTLEMRTYYDYDDGDESYNIVSDKKFVASLKVEGNCQKTPAEQPEAPTISAELDSETPEAIAGNQVIIRATIENNENSQQTYTIGVYENSAWSDLVSIEPKSLTIGAGQSRDVNIMLNIDSGIEGDRELVIRATYGSDNEFTTQQKVALTVVGKEIGAGPIIEHFKNNWFIYAIILVNLILIIAIIVVIVKMMRPRTA